MNKKVIQNYKVLAQDQGKRLDLFATEMAGISRSQVQKLISEGLLLVNNQPQKSKYLLEEKDLIELFELEAKKAPLIPIIFEDKQIIVINKPSGVSAHKSSGDNDIAVDEIFKEKLDFPKNFERPGIVHRLDKGTSGVMILAKNQNILEKLQKEFKNRNVKKKYVALIEGEIVPPQGIINIPIRRDEIKRERMMASKEGKEAVTEYNTIQSFSGRTLLEIYPKTGRTHQIRVHLSALGYPIVGDQKYGKKHDNLGRIFLHAAEITFRHPETEKMVKFTASLPKELADFIAELPRN